MPRSIPDRWKDYKPIGKRIEGTRFIAFKVPLKEHILKHVDSKIHLDDNLLQKMIPNLGLIIDLTNTNRYYDPKIFQKQGIEHKKLMIPGHETPHKHLTNQFIGIVKEFLEKNKDNDKLIGVHCTHGVNRTGYMICNYMITQMTIEPNEALAKFADARGHKIERKNYINNLQDQQKTKTQNVTAKTRVEPENWRESKVDNVQSENWRQSGQQRIENDHKKISSGIKTLGGRSCEESHHSFQSFYRAKSPLLRSNRSRGSCSRSKSPLLRSHHSTRNDSRSKSPLLRSHHSTRNDSRSKSLLLRSHHSTRNDSRSKSPLLRSHHSTRNDSRSKSPLLRSHHSTRNDSRSKSPLLRSHHSTRNDSRSKSPLLRSHYSTRNDSRSKSSLLRSHHSKRNDFRSKSPLLRSHHSKRNDSRSKSPLCRSIRFRRNSYRSKSPLSRSHYSWRRIASFSRPRTTDIVNERPRYIVPPAEVRNEQLKYSKSVSNETSRLRLDYYNKRPVGKIQHKRDLLSRPYF